MTTTGLVVHSGTGDTSTVCVAVAMTHPYPGDSVRRRTLAVMDDSRFEPGMPVLDRQPLPEPSLSPSLRGLPPRSVPETAPTPLQPHYVNLSVVALIAGVVAITSLEMGAGLGHPLVKVAVLMGAPLLFVTTADATVRIWRSAWAWMRVDRGKGLFRLAWVVASATLLALIAGTATTVLTA